VEARNLKLGYKGSLQMNYGNQALILHAWGRLEEAMVLHKKSGRALSGSWAIGAVWLTATGTGTL
jgi:hypothetical protein